MTGAKVRNDWQRVLWQSLLTGLGFFLLGYGGIQATGHGRMIALIWPATAFAVCMIARLSRSRRQDLAMLAAICVAEVVMVIQGPVPGLLNADRALPFRYPSGRYPSCIREPPHLGDT